MKTQILALLAIIATILVTPTSCWRKQRAHVKGILMCGDEPASGVKVELVDEDTGPDPDDHLDSGYTNANGHFNLQGTTRELTNIDPEIRIYHDCDDGVLPCQRRFTFGVPDKYINKGVFDLGTVNLEIQIPHDETHDCIH